MLADLQSYPQLIREIASYTHRINGAVAQHKAIARLADGSNLHINEVWIDNADLHRPRRLALPGSRPRPATGLNDKTW